MHSIKGVGLVILIDQVTKYGAGVAQLTHLNFGMAFGWMGQWSSLILVLVSVGVIGLLAKSLQSVWLAQPVASSLFFGGAISNLIDRVLYNGVRDWLPIPGTNLHNNLADWALSLAVVWLVLVQLRKSIHE